MSALYVVRAKISLGLKKKPELSQSDWGGVQGSFLGKGDHPQARSWPLLPRPAAGQQTLKQRAVHSHSVPGNKTNDRGLVKAGERRGERGMWGD